MAEQLGVWVYAVAERAGPACPGRLAGVGGGPVRALPAAELAAVVSDVPLAEFGEDALRRNLEDLAWLEETAREHHRVIEAVTQQGQMVPMRLATVYSDDASVAAMLADRGEDFRMALRRIRARKEWGVKAYAAPSPAPGTGRAAALHGAAARSGGGAGAAYLQRRRAQLSAQRDARGEATASAQAVHDTLSRLAAEARLHPPQAPQLSGSKAQMVLNAAYLVDDDRADGFATAVATLAEQHPGVRLELTGPWPPYSFAGSHEGGRS